MSFTGKVIIVTGASSGIGAHTAKHLAKLGAKMCLIGRNEGHLRSVAEDIKTSGSLVQPLVTVADVTKDAERIVSDAVNHFGKLDVLINNAGIFRGDTVNNFSVTQFDEVFNTNLKAAVTITSLAVPHLEKTKGNIVNISSALGINSITGTMSYSMSKAALIQFTKCAAFDLAPKGIRVNSICPAMVRTPFLVKLGMHGEEAEIFLESAMKMHPMGRMGEPTDVSEAITYVASDSASFTTGVVLPVDGGFLIK